MSLRASLMVLSFLVLACLSYSLCLEEGFVNPDYSLVRLGQVLNRRECGAIVNAVKDRFSRSTVLGADGVSDVRTSETAWLSESVADDDSWAVVQKIRGIASRITGITDPSKFEDLQVVRYSPGGEYKAHFDSAIALTDSADVIDRYATLIVYLNDGFEGGETAFPKLDVKIKPKRGMGVLFYNLDAAGEEHAMSLHESIPVRRGTKYAVQLWIRR